MSEPAQSRVAGWDLEEHLAFDIGFALSRTPKGLRRALTEDERRAMAKAIVEHLKTMWMEVSDDVGFLSATQEKALDAFTRIICIGGGSGSWRTGNRHER
jgi:hypothetical protein